MRGHSSRSGHSICCNSHYFAQLLIGSTDCTILDKAWWYRVYFFLVWLPMSFKLVGYCIICWCCNNLLHFITVIYSCCCKSNYSAGQVPAVGSKVGRFVGTRNVSKIAALESITDAPVNRDVNNCCWAWTLGVTIALSTSPSQAGRVVGKLRAQVYLKDCSSSQVW